MAAEQIHVVILRLSDLPLLARRRYDWRKLAGVTFHVQRVIVLVVLVTHAEQDVRIPECLRDVKRDYVARFVDVTERRNEFARGIKWSYQAGQGRIAPNSRIFLAKAKLVVVTDRYFRPIWYTQAQFDPRIAPIDMHFGKRRREPCACVWLGK